MIYLEENERLIPNIYEDINEGSHKYSNYDNVLFHIKNTNIRLEKLNGKLDNIIETVDNLLND